MLGDPLSLVHASVAAAQHPVEQRLREHALAACIDDVLELREHALRSGAGGLDEDHQAKRLLPRRERVPAQLPPTTCGYSDADAPAQENGQLARLWLAANATQM